MRRNLCALRLMPAVVTTLILAILTGCSDDNGKRTTDPPADRPVILSMQPDTVVEGTTAWIRGQRFGASQGQSQILFGSLPAQSLRWTETRVLAVVPDAVAPGGLTVSVGGETSDPLAYKVATRAPRISRLDRESAEAGDAIVIEGSLFGAVQRDGKVLFGTIEATTTSWADTMVQAIVPQDAHTGTVQIEARSLASNGMTITVLVPLEPLIELVEPDSAAPGAAVRISGQDFGADAARGMLRGLVRIGGADATVTGWSATAIDALVPMTAAPGAGIVQVYADGIASNAYPFHVLDAEGLVVITRLEPARTTVQDIITIYGTGFRNESMDPVITFQGPQSRIEGSMTGHGQDSMLVQVPLGAVDGPVIVQFGNQVSNGVPFSVAPRRISFTTDVHPLFEAKACLACHAGAGASGNLVLSTKADALRGDSDHGPVVIPRNGPGSTIVRKVSPNPPFLDRMPLGCTTGCLGAEEILILSDWIDQGTDD